jgi:hypothetical protein
MMFPVVAALEAMDNTSPGAQILPGRTTRTGGLFIPAVPSRAHSSTFLYGPPTTCPAPWRTSKPALTPQQFRGHVNQVGLTNAWYLRLRSIWTEPDGQSSGHAHQEHAKQGGDIGGRGTGTPRPPPSTALHVYSRTHKPHALCRITCTLSAGLWPLGYAQVVLHGKPPSVSTSLGLLFGSLPPEFATSETRG